jgi:signal transduction histidine kinase
VELFVTAATVILNILLGLSIYLKNSKGSTHRYFFLLTIIIAGWAVANYFSLHSPDEDTTLMWIRAVMAITSFLMPTVFLLASAFPRSSSWLPRRVVSIILAVAALTAVAALSPYMFVDVSLENGVVAPSPGPLILLYGAQFFFYLVAAVAILVRRYFSTVGLEKLQIKYLLAGSLVTFGLIGISNFILVLWFQITIYVLLGPFFSLILAGVIAYAIAKHRFLDLNVVIARSVAYLVLLTILATVYSLLLFSTQRAVLRQLTVTEQIIVSVLISLVIVITFQPIKEWLDKETSRIFFHRSYRPHQIMEEVGQVATATLNLQNLTSRVLSIFSGRMSLEGAAILLKMNEYGMYMRAKGKLEGQDKKAQLHQIKTFELFRSALRRHKEKILVFDEMPESPLKHLMRVLELGLIVPLIVRRRLIGFLTLQHKANGLAFSLEDIRMVQLLAPQLSIMINNALAFSEIKHFNTVLEEEINRATKELKKANSELKELDKLKDEFVSIASHELRTPLTAIKSYLWMALAGKGGKLNSKLQNYVERAYRSTNRLIKLVNDMLNISQLESGRMMLNIKPISLRRLVEEVIEEVRPRSQELGLEVTMKLPATKKDDQLMVVGDEDKLGEVLLNLVGNALKFTNKGGKINISVKREKGRKYLVTITDTGVGMTEETMNSIFQKFGLVAGSYRTNKQAKYGTGLGLYISKSIVELHGGEIWADSAGKGKGSSFYFTVPISQNQ